MINGHQPHLPHAPTHETNQHTPICQNGTLKPSTSQNLEKIPLGSSTHNLIKEKLEHDLIKEKELSTYGLIIEIMQLCWGGLIPNCMIAVNNVRLKGRQVLTLLTQEKLFSSDTFHLEWTGTVEHLSLLKNEMLLFIQEKDQDFSPENITINREDSSIQMVFTDITIRFIFSQVPKKPLSSKECLSIVLFEKEENKPNIIDWLQGNIKIQSEGLSVAEVLSDALHGIYRPLTDLTPDHLLGWLFHNTQLTPDVSETELLNVFLKSLPDTDKAQALYLLIKRKLNDEKNRDTSFLFRVCQYLSTHANLEDEVIDQLWDLFEQDGLLNGDVSQIEMDEPPIKLILHPNPGVSYFGVLIGMNCLNNNNRALFFAYLPKILEVSAPHPETIQSLYQMTQTAYGMENNLTVEELALSHWITLLAQTGQRDLVYLALRFLKKKSGIQLRLLVLKQWLRHDPRSAVPKFTRLLKILKPNDSLNDCLLFVRTYQQQVRLGEQSELKPLVDHLIQHGRSQAQSVRPAMINFLENSSETDSYFLNALKKGLLTPSDLTPALLNRLVALMLTKIDANNLTNNDDQKIFLELCKHLKTTSESSFSDCLNRLKTLNFNSKIANQYRTFLESYKPSEREDDESAKNEITESNGSTQVQEAPLQPPESETPTIDPVSEEWNNCKTSLNIEKPPGRILDFLTHLTPETLIPVLQPSDLASIEFILSRLFTEIENKKSTKKKCKALQERLSWIKPLLAFALQQGSTIETGLTIDPWIQLVKGLTPLGTPQMIRFCLLAHHAGDVGMSALAEREFKNCLAILDVTICSDLIVHYFPSDPLKWQLLWNRIKGVKNQKSVILVWQAFKKAISENEYTKAWNETWRTALDCITLYPSALPGLLDPLPSFLTTEAARGLKDHTLQLIVRATLSSKTKIQVKKDPSWETTIASQATSLPFDLFLNWLNCVPEEVLTHRYQECLNIFCAVNLSYIDSNKLELTPDAARNLQTFVNLSIQNSNSKNHLQAMQNLFKILSVFLHLSKDQLFEKQIDSIFGLVNEIFIHSLELDPENKTTGARIIDQCVDLLVGFYQKAPETYLGSFFSFLNEKHELREKSDLAEGVKNLKIKFVEALCNKFSLASKPKKEQIRKKIERLLTVGLEREADDLYRKPSSVSREKTAYPFAAGLHSLLHASKLNILKTDSTWIFRYLNLFSPMADLTMIKSSLNQQNIEENLLIITEQLLNYGTPFSFHCAARRFGDSLEQQHAIPFIAVLSMLDKLLIEAKKHPGVVLDRESYILTLDGHCKRPPTQQKLSERYSDEISHKSILAQRFFDSSISQFKQLIISKEPSQIALKAHYLYLSLVYFIETLDANQDSIEFTPFTDTCQMLTEFILQMEIELSSTSIGHVVDGVPKPGELFRLSTLFMCNPALNNVVKAEKGKMIQPALSNLWFELIIKSGSIENQRQNVLKMLFVAITECLFSSEEPETIKLFENIDTWLNASQMTPIEVEWYKYLRFVYNRSTYNDELFERLFLGYFSPVKAKSLSLEKIKDYYALLDLLVKKMEANPSLQFQQIYLIFLWFSQTLFKRMKDQAIAKETLFEYLMRGILSKLFLPYESDFKMNVLDLFQHLKSSFTTPPKYEILFELAEHAFYTLHLDDEQLSAELVTRLSGFIPKFCQFAREPENQHYLDFMQKLISFMKESNRKTIYKTMNQLLTTTQILEKSIQIGLTQGMQVFTVDSKEFMQSLGF